MKTVKIVWVKRWCFRETANSSPSGSIPAHTTSKMGSGPVMISEAGWGDDLQYISHKYPSLLYSRVV
jgi:hypothetical protein